MSARHVITYPFPLDDGTLAYLTVPPDLTREEADRIRGFVATLPLDADETNEAPNV